MSYKGTVRAALEAMRTNASHLSEQDLANAALSALDQLRDPKERKKRDLSTYSGPRNKRGETRASILKALAECPHGLTSGECGKAAGVSRVTARHFLGKLQAEGVVYQTPYMVGAYSIWQLVAK